MAELPKVIYIMGPPGAGKGTQAKLLCEKIGYHNFSTGDAFREVSRQDTDLGRQVKETIDNGYLCPPELAAEVVISAVSTYAAEGRGLVFDGTPRTVKEAAMVDEYFEKEGLGSPLIFFLKLDKEEMIRRNSERKFCLGVKGDFPVVTDADRKKCDELGGTVGTRPDDEPEKFATRWDEFMNQTYPVVESYREKELVQEIDGMESIEQVHSAILKVVDTYDQTSD